MAGISIERVSKRYGTVAAVRDLSLEVRDREFVTLLGPSGCGKTTLLRLIAGFSPDEGVIRVGGSTLSSADAVVPPGRRGMGMVFQNYAIWPHKTVYENVAFGLTVRRVRGARRASGSRGCWSWSTWPGSSGGFPASSPAASSSGVALARSLVVEPQILLLDEPLSNLDAKLRERMRWELKDLQRRTGITFVYVTHDQAEAMALSDRIAVLHGRAPPDRRPARGLRAAGQPRGRRLHGPRQPAARAGWCSRPTKLGLGRRRRARPVCREAALAEGSRGPGGDPARASDWRATDSRPPARAPSRASSPTSRSSAT